MVCRRLVGIDLGIASAHAVRVLDEEGNTVAKRKAVPTVESLSVIESSALDGTPSGTRLEVVIEPTGPAWLPIAVLLHQPWSRRVSGELDAVRGPASVLVAPREDQCHRC